MSDATIRRPKCAMVVTFTDERCIAKAVAWVQVGCVHEHVKVGAACAKHKKMLLAGDPLISCTPCQEGGNSHYCELLPGPSAMRRGIGSSVLSHPPEPRPERPAPLHGRGRAVPYAAQPVRPISDNPAHNPRARRPPWPQQP